MMEGKFLGKVSTYRVDIDPEISLISRRCHKPTPNATRARANPTFSASRYLRKFISNLSEATTICLVVERLDQEVCAVNSSGNQLICYAQKQAFTCSMPPKFANAT